MSEKSIIDRIRDDRLKGVKNGTIPAWMTTNGYSMFDQKYVVEGETVKSTFERIAKAAAKHLPEELEDEARDKFFGMLWNGWLALATPVLANMGTTRGMPVSCSGGVIDDSIYGFYDSQIETAILTQQGFGTSSYLGEIRPRGAIISTGGNASGALPVVKDFVQVSRDVSQGNTRRGSWAGYLEADHEDFHEVVDYLNANPDDMNIGWVFTDDFIARLQAGDEDALHRWRRIMKTKCITGKGYIFKVDTVNRANPVMYKDLDLRVKASNLCTEIALHSDADHTFTCVLSSLNASRYDEWKDTDTVYWATIFLDCVAEEFIQRGREVRGLEKAVRATEKGRALGLGLLGFHTYLQENSIPFEKADEANQEIFSLLDSESLRASKWMAEALGEPEWCRGYGLRNTHRLAVAPNTSSALICGSVSQGIEPIVENVFNQSTAAGEMERVNPVFLALAKSKKKWNKALAKDIIDNNGSVQHLEWLTDHEKEVFKTAFEINQYDILRLASQRQQYIDQAQSINLFFDADASEAHISSVHRYGVLDKNIKSLYYMRSKAGVQAASESECLACEG